MSAFTIRALGPEDAALLRPLRQRALTEEGAAFLSSPEEDASRSDEELRARLAADAGAAFTLGAIDDTGALVGMLGVYREMGRKKSSHKAQAWGMYVAPEARRRGIARALLCEAVARARAMKGVTSMRLSVTETQSEAAALYAASGFVVWGREPDAVHVESASLAEDHLILRL